MLTVDTIPLRRNDAGTWRCVDTGRTHRVSAPLRLRVDPSLRFLVILVLAATATKLTKLKSVGRSLLVFGRYVVAALTVYALQHNVIAWHN